MATPYNPLEVPPEPDHLDQYSFTSPLFDSPQTYIEKHGVFAFIGYFALHRAHLTIIYTLQDPSFEYEISKADIPALEHWIDNAAKWLPNWAKQVLGEVE